MPTENDVDLIYRRGWAFRQIHSPSRPITHVAVLIHGWTGDENSMDIFGRELPDGYLKLFPRGPVSAPSGYGWAQQATDGWPTLSVFEDPCRSLMKELDLRMAELGVPDLPIRLVGFSQGAVMCHTLTLLFPERIERTAILAGFLPEIDIPVDRTRLAGKHYFIAHGQKDDTIPISLAYESVQVLKASGADVEFCESGSGHKLALKCLKDFQKFITA